MNSFQELLKSALNKMSQQIEFQTARKDSKCFIKFTNQLLTELTNGFWQKFSSTNKYKIVSLEKTRELARNFLHRVEKIMGA